MPVDVRQLDGGLGIEMAPTGCVTIHTVKEALRAREPFLGQARYVLVDFSQTELLDISGEDVRMVVETDNADAVLYPLICQAIVGPVDLSFGIGRIYSALADEGPWPSRILRTRPEARAWLRE